MRFLVHVLHSWENCLGDWICKAHIWFPKVLLKISFELGIMYSGSPCAYRDWTVHVLVKECCIVVCIKGLVNILSNRIGRRGKIDFARFMKQIVDASKSVSSELELYCDLLGVERDVKISTFENLSKVGNRLEIFESWNLRFHLLKFSESLPK